MTNVYSNNYLKTQIETASKEQLLIMFYDGAIRFTNKAISAIDNNNIEQKNYFINKASAIISELSATLDHKVGATVTTDLEALYDYMIRELYKANTSNDSTNLGTVLTILTDLRDTWKEAILKLKKTQKNPIMQQADNHKSLTVSF